jgi:hypothetical protein
MSKHESKTCPRCSTLFECRLGDITKCQCYGIKLTDAERDYMGRQFSDCLCTVCMTELRTAYNQVQQEIQLKQFFGLR